MSALLSPPNEKKKEMNDRFLLVSSALNLSFVSSAGCVFCADAADVIIIIIIILTNRIV